MRIREFSTGRAWTPALIVVLALASWTCAGQGDEEGYSQARKDLVSFLKRGAFGREAITDPKVLEAMEAVPRHRFVPDAMKPNAYQDSPLPIGHDQTISQPYIVALMTQYLEVDSDDVVLEVGTGSGYQAAVLGEMAKAVYTIEIVAPLGRQSRALLEELGYKNVHVRIGDGYKGWEEHAPYDGIIVTAAPDHVPQPLLDQLKPGGRMVIPVGPQRSIQELVVITKDEDGGIHREIVEQVAFVPFTGDGVRDGRKER